MPTATPGPPAATPVPTAPPAPTPSASVTPIAEARATPDGTSVTIEAVALTASDFHDGGGFVADATGGIAVLFADGEFGPGELLRITGDVDDRFSQRTLRADSAEVVRLGTAAGPAPILATTGSVDEDLEGRLVRIRGTVQGSPTTLTSGLAFDVDDGSGAIRVVVGTSTGIDPATWRSGSALELVGVAGQRDSSGSGTDGYRVFPRDPGDVLGVVAPGASPTPGAAAWRRRRHADLQGSRSRGEHAASDPRRRDPPARSRRRTDGRSAGRERGDPPSPRSGSQSRPARRPGRGHRRAIHAQRHGVAASHRVDHVARDRLRAGGEDRPNRRCRRGRRGEARRGARRDRRVGPPLVDRDGLFRDRRWQRTVAGQPVGQPCAPTRGPLVAGTWVEVRGVLGQETSGSRPDEGYRIWPRAASEVRVTAPVTTAGGSTGSAGGGSVGHAGVPTGSLDDLGTADLSRLRIGATLVVGPWTEMRVGGLLWDGTRLVAVHPSSALVVARLTRERRPPFALDLGGLQAMGSEPLTGVPIVQARRRGRPDGGSEGRARAAACRVRRRLAGLGFGGRSAGGPAHAPSPRGGR